MRLLPLAGTFLILFAGTAVVLAQPGYPGNWGWGSGWGGGYHHASTAAEGFTRGMGDLVRSAGAANLYNSEAAKNYEDARSKYFDNRLKGTQTYFEMRRLNREYRESERGPRPTPEQLFRINESKKPAELNTSELDPLTGEIQWPSILMTEAFDQQRADMEDMYAEWARHQEFVSSGDYQKIKQIGSDMEATLKSQIKQLSANDYIEGKSFIKSLVYAPRRASS